MIDTSKSLNVNIMSCLQNVRIAKFSGATLKDTSFLKYIPNVEELELGGLQSFDFADLLPLKKIRKLTICKSRELCDLDALHSFKGLKELKFWNVRKIEIPKNEIRLELEKLEIGFTPKELPEVFLKNSTIRTLSISYSKQVDFGVIGNYDALEELSINDMKVINITKLSQCKNIIRLNLNTENELMGKENNNEVESYVKKLVKKSGQKRKFLFDSEAENFCVYANKLEDLKWLIDLLCEYIKKDR